MIKDIIKQPIFKYSLLAEVIGIILVTLAAAGGHGTYAPFIIIFPYTMLSTVFYEVIKVSFLFVGLFQYPFYGLVMSWAVIKKFKNQAILALALTHLIAVFIVLARTKEHF